MAYILIEVCRGRREELATFELASRAVEVAKALCLHSLVTSEVRLDYEVVSFYGNVEYETSLEEFERDVLVRLYDKVSD